MAMERTGRMTLASIRWMMWASLDPMFSDLPSRAPTIPAEKRWRYWTCRPRGRVGRGRCGLIPRGRGEVRR